ncbi:hypothetical protein [Flagellimonas meridianipacifica]|uniref:hypothetical protein n=1 Tax=Flagellimonas meridianipacifica TaxID=1080225 RepID=UPI0011B1E75D|nr:hypothetical protein [Allomuricauda pacifica]
MKRRRPEVNYYNFIKFLGHLNIIKIRLNDRNHLAVVKGNIVETITIEQLSKLVLDKILNRLPESYDFKERQMAANVIVEKSQKLYHSNTLNYLECKELPIRRDSKNSCAINFSNGILHIFAKEVEFEKHRDVKSLILKSSIVDHEFSIEKERGDFRSFVWKVSGRTLNRYKALVCTLGYLAHRYKDPANPKIVILVDEIADEHNIANGGRGKSLLLRCLKYIRNCEEIAGKTFQSSARFAYQRVTIATNNILINDVTKYESLDNFYNVSSDDFVIERKFEKEEVIPYKYSPKIAITANNLLKQTEGFSSERRKHEIEISGYYGKHLNPKTDFGRTLFDEWDTEEWNRFYNFIAWSVSYYLKFGLVEAPKININQRKLLNQVGPELTEYLDELLRLGKTKLHKKDTYNEFIKGGYLNRRYIPNQGSFTRKIKKYFEYRELNYREVPSDTRQYFEVLTQGGATDSEPTSIKDIEVDYQLVKTKAKMSSILKIIKE